MDSEALRKAVSQALEEKGRGCSQATVYREVAKTRAKYPGASQKQAWLLLAYDLDVRIADYEHDAKELNDVGDLRKRWGSTAVSMSPARAPDPKAPPPREGERLPRENFDFVSDPKMQEICKRDYLELGKVRRARAHKSTIVLSGGLLEAMLHDALSRKPAAAKASYKRVYPKRKRVVWTLECLIEVAEDMGIITPGATQLSHTLRDYRNLVHPRKEISSGYKVEKEEAEIAMNMVRIVMRDLTKPEGV